MVEDVDQDDRISPDPILEANGSEQVRIQAVYVTLRWRMFQGFVPQDDVEYFARLACRAEPPLQWEPPPTSEPEQPLSDLGVSDVVG